MASMFTTVIKLIPLHMLKNLDDDGYVLYTIGGKQWSLLVLNT